MVDDDEERVAAADRRERLRDRLAGVAERLVVGAQRAERVRRRRPRHRGRAVDDRVGDDVHLGRRAAARVDDGTKRPDVDAGGRVERVDERADAPRRRRRRRRASSRSPAARRRRRRAPLIAATILSCWRVRSAGSHAPRRSQPVLTVTGSPVRSLNDVQPGGVRAERGEVVQDVERRDRQVAADAAASGAAVRVVRERDRRRTACHDLGGRVELPDVVAVVDDTGAVNVAAAPTRTGLVSETYGGRQALVGGRQEVGRRSRRRGPRRARRCRRPPPRPRPCPGARDLGRLDQRRGAGRQADLAVLVRAEGVGDGERPGRARRASTRAPRGRRPWSARRPSPGSRCGRGRQHARARPRATVSSVSPLNSLTDAGDRTWSPTATEPTVADEKTKTASDAVCVASSAPPVPGVWMT